MNKSTIRAMNKNEKNKKMDIIIGNNIKKLRVIHKIKKAEISELLGLTIHTIEQIENGKQGIKSSYIYKLSQFYSVPSDYFFQGVDVVDLNNKNETTNRIITYMDDFSQAELNFVVRLVEAVRRLR